MWGHAACCGCTICRCLPRIHQLILQGSSLPYFVDFVGLRLRNVEADLRDELGRRGFPEGRTVPPNSVAAPDPPAPAAATPVEEEKPAAPPKTAEPAATGKEKKRRDERPPEPDRPPLPRPDRRIPQEPNYPPPHRQGGRPAERGRGWVGPVPYSDHPRWYTGKSKGVVRRAKQERFNNRRPRRYR